MSFKIKLILISLILSNVIYASESSMTKGNEMSIEDNWKKLVLYYKEKEDSKSQKEVICKGATNAEIDTLKKLYENIPDSLIRSLKICNPKYEDNHTWINTINWGSLYDISEIIDMTKQDRKYGFFVEEGIYKNIYGNVENPKNSAPKEWIPIYDWNGDFRVVIDMRAKNKGQVIIFAPEDSILAKWTDSYEEWFELAVNEVIKYGELRFETIADVLHIKR